jgi:hypothetical protein
MPKLLEKQALAGDLAAVTKLLESRSSEEDPMGRLAYEERKKQLEEELASLEVAKETLASVALLFSGEPVYGSRSIDASFAAAALGKYQDIVARLYADQTDERGLPERGPIPHKDLSALQITDVAHGSFGFILSEQDSGQLVLFDTSIKQTLDRATEMISAFGAPQDDAYAALVETVNGRVFGSMKDFFAVLHEARAAVRLVEGERDEAIDYAKVERAFERSQKTTIEEEEETFEGVLIGILPTPMQFEFQPDGREPISGKTGPSISRTYLERINADERTVGSRCVAKILTRTTVRPTGQTSRKYTLLDLSIP